MQDRYLGDIGDFAKFGLLRALVGDERGLRLGVLWYRVPDESHTNDGRHIDYLQPTAANINRYRVCDPVLYDSLGALVRAGSRVVSAVSESRLLPADTTYHDEPLSFRDVAPGKRRAHREQWLAKAHERVADAALVFLDPDNGIEVKTDRHTREGPKYAYYDDVTPLSRAGKTVVIYQHANRDGSFADQIRGRLAALQSRLGGPTEAFVAVRWLRLSPRAFIVAVASDHLTMMRTRLDGFLASPWGRHFERVSPHS